MILGLVSPFWVRGSLCLSSSSSLESTYTNFLKCCKELECFIDIEINNVARKQILQLVRLEQEMKESSSAEDEALLKRNITYNQFCYSLMNLEYPLDDGYFSFKHIQIIKCKEHKFIIIGWNSSETEYSAIVIPKLRANEELRPLKQLIQEFGPFKAMDEIKKEIENNIGTYHEKESIFAHGIVGFHKFLQGYYLTYIKENEAIAKIGRHKIYEIKATDIVQLFQLRSDETQDSEKKYKQILEEYKIENYYYSCTYDLTNMLPRNMIANSMPLFNIQLKNKNFTESVFSKKEQFLGICEMFQYNYELVREFHGALTCKKWILSVIHGFAKHINLKMKGTTFNLIIIARRSRHHAGTRYIKRGISSEGFAANYVEVEQIVVNYNSSQDTRPVCSSFVQVRGSVPTYWMQKPSVVVPKPAIELRKNADYMCVATRKHFHDLVSRYGRILFCINLMKQKEKTPRQSELSREYQNAITLINKNDLKEENLIHYCEIDMKFELKRDKKAFVQQIKTLAFFAIQRTGIFICVNPSTSSHQQLLQFQNGIIRANCVDCLDRTNSFQQLVGETVLAIQLHRLIGEEIRLDQLQLEENIMEVYSKLYEEMGDLISIQYGSSLAHKQKIQKSTESRFEFLTSIKRHWNNIFKDEDRQVQLDVFLGCKTDPDGPQIWDVKPAIEHYPDEYAYTFEKMKKGEWFDRAYENFVNYYHFRDFERVGRKDICELTVPKLEKLTKEQLIHKFRAEIVSSLINDKQQPSNCSWIIEPKVLIKQRVWKEMNPRSATIRTLHEELSLQYNKMDFLKSEEAQSTHMAPIKLKKQPKENRKPSKTSKLSLEEDIDFLRDVEKFVSREILDDDEVKLIEKTWQGQIVDDDEIERNVDQLYSLVGQDVLLDDFMNKNCITQVDIAAEMKRIEANLASHNFIGNGEEVKGEVIYKRDLKPEQKSPNNLQPRRKEVVRENKAKMLEQIINKTFSHGGVNHFTEV